MIKMTKRTGVEYKQIKIPTEILALAGGASGIGVGVGVGVGMGGGGIYSSLQRPETQ